MKHKGQDIPKYFRLEQLQDEFNFVSEEEMKKSKRFQLLQLRNAGHLDVFLLQQMPLYDREIPGFIFQVVSFLFACRLLYAKLIFCFKSILSTFFVLNWQSVGRFSTLSLGIKNVQISQISESL